MSLQGLLVNYFSVVQPQNVQLSDGSIRRDIGWLPLYSDIKANIQGIEAQDIVYEYGIKNRRNGFIIFHTKELDIQEHYRIYTAQDYRQKLRNDFSNVRIFEFRGTKEPVRLSNRQKHLYELYVEETFIRIP